MKCTSFLALALSVGFWGCASDNPGTTAPPTVSGTTYHYQVLVQNLQHVEPAERFVLWVRTATDTAWRKADTLQYSVYGLYDSLKYSGDATLDIDPSLISRALVSIEPNGWTAQPTAKLIAGDYNTATNSASLSTNDVDGVGDYTDADASVTFTTKSPDTNRAKSEFYLMGLDNGKPTPSAQNLPVPRAGWTYGLWVTDSNFFPLHQFFYGSFTNPNGPDSDPTNDSYPYPGGYKPSPLNDPGATISLVLMLEFSIATKPVTPSAFTVLGVDLQKFIDYNETLVMSNETQTTMPSGTLILSK